LHDLSPNSYEQNLDLAVHSKTFNDAVQKSLHDRPEKRKARLKLADRLPLKVIVSSYSYNRNPDVVAEVLERAEGKCERCGHEAPFKRKKDGQPYLEVHHKIQLSLGGEDTVNNALALCPNCHRYLHFGAASAQPTSTEA
jgi:5-methylcytosine-specific restriction protein A